MIGKLAAPDERQSAVADAAYRLAYSVVSFGVLLSVAYRGLVLNQASWDLLAWVILGGAAATLYQARSRALSSRWVAAGIGTAAIAAAVAIVLAALTH